MMIVRRALPILAGFTTFALGLAITAVAVVDHSPDLPNLSAVRVIEVETATNTTPGLTFESFSGVACGFDDSGVPASWSSFRASDGTVIQSTLLLFESEKQAARRLSKLTSAAEKLIESGPYTNYRNDKIGETAVLKKNGEYISVRLKKDPFYSSTKRTVYSMSILTSRSLDHLLAFEKQGE